MNNGHDFTGKVVIVTGSGAGIGEDAAINFAIAGAQVVIADKNEPAAKDVAVKCTKVSPKGLRPLVVITDISRDEDCKKLIQLTIDTFNQLDVLVNNAGINFLSNLDDDNLMESYDKIFATDCRPVLLLTKLAIPHLEKKKGVIINVASFVSKVGSTRSIPYCMAKAAVDNLTKCSALQLGPRGIRVVGIEPGTIRTTMNRNRPAEEWAKMAALIPLRRPGDVTETSAAILFAASPGASYITGSSIEVDGGILTYAGGDYTAVNRVE